MKFLLRARRSSAWRTLVLCGCCAFCFLAAARNPPRKPHGSPAPSPAPVSKPPPAPTPLPPGAGFANAAAWLGGAYWRDGKAEFNTYDARLVRYGTARPCEVIHILVREDFAPNSMVKADNWQQPGAYPVLKLNQILHIPTGVYVYQQMHSSFWRVGDGSLIKWSLTSNDSCGNTFKEALRAATKGADEPSNPWKYEFRTYWQGMEGGEETLRPPADGYFYEELPVLVRTIDFAAEQKTFPVHLTKSVINSKRDTLSFAPAEVSFAVDPEKGNISVTVAHADGKDEFLLDAKPPHLLRVWHMADGGEMRLTSSLKIDYWNYNKVGDKERAQSELKNNAAESGEPAPAASPTPAPAPSTPPAAP